ncbi:hypothetical protein SAMN05216551_109208 [Chitinasiproducens palmae]|uniref:Uncharacterized protein n=1 Tax=Chitinasiproducens palmae TaxID=1770053 RepID=A0A1H2PSD4_9BURK|nr:hypothetical protein SAMN05216551_109208 [Chitinasiproducens palmae]
MMPLGFVFHRPEPIPGEPARDPMTEPHPEDAPGAVPLDDDDESKGKPLEHRRGRR